MLQVLNKAERIVMTDSSIVKRTTPGIFVGEEVFDGKN